MKPLSIVPLVILLASFTLYSCFANNFDDNLDNLKIGLVDSTGINEDSNDNSQLEYKVVPSDFDWTNIPDSYAGSIWGIRYDFDLGGLAVRLPANVILRFEGGILNNYASISGTNTKIDAGLVGSLDGAGVLEGTWDLQEVYPEWFGAVGNGTTFDSESFISAVSLLNSMGGGNLTLSKGKNYVIDKEILIYSNIHILGNSAHISVPTTNYNVSPNRNFAIFTTVHIPSRPMHMVRLSSGSIQFYNIHIKDINFNINRDGKTMALGWMLSSDFNAIRLVDTQEGIVENCTFLDKQTSTINILTAVVNFDNSFNSIARNNTFNKCGAIRTNDGSANIIDGNVINNSPGTAIEIYLGTNHQIINNELNKQWVDASSLGCSANYAIVRNNRINSSNATGITMGHPNVYGFPPFGSDYSLVESNYIKGGPVTKDSNTGEILTGGVGILLHNGIGARIINNEIEGLFKDTEYSKDSGAILIGGASTDQTLFDDLVIDGNKIIGATIGIHIKDMINVSISNNNIDNVFAGIYGECDIANSPNSKMIIDKNTINNSDLALRLNGSYNIITNNTITTTDAVGLLYNGHYIINSNIINEGLKGLNLFHPLSFTMKDNYFYNTDQLGDLATGSLVTLTAPNMDLKDLIVEGTRIDFPASGRPTTWALRAYELKGYVGSQYFK